jgi:hypothetical protein
VNFVSLAGVHLGQYGGSNPVTTKNIYKVFYTPMAQATFSVASYWQDPYHEELFFNTSVFLPEVNNYQQDPSK